MMVFSNMSSIKTYLPNKIKIGWHWGTLKIYQRWKKMTSVFQFQVGYMTHPTTEKKGHTDKRLSRCFHPHFKTKQWKLSEIYCKKYVLFISLIILYHSNKSVVFKVMGYVIYSFVNNFICLDYLGILQQKLSPDDNKFEKLSSMICSSW